MVTAADLSKIERMPSTEIDVPVDGPLSDRHYVRRVKLHGFGEIRISDDPDEGEETYVSRDGIDDPYLNSDEERFFYKPNGNGPNSETIYVEHTPEEGWAATTESPHTPETPEVGEGEAVLITDNGYYDEDEEIYHEGDKVVRSVPTEDLVIRVDVINSIPEYDIYSVYKMFGFGEWDPRLADPEMLGAMSLHKTEDSIVLVGERVHIQKDEGIENSVIVLNPDSVRIEYGPIEDESLRGTEFPRDKIPKLHSMGEWLEKAQ